MIPFKDDLELLDTIPGVGRRMAEQIGAETGTDMARTAECAHRSGTRRRTHQTPISPAYIIASRQEEKRIELL